LSGYDLVVRGGTCVGLEGPTQSDIAVVDGKVVAVAPGLEGMSREEVDAAGLHVFPGVIDAHVHFNEPGRTHWEGFATGTRALAAGGTTTYLEMPLNARPPTLDVESFDLKLAAARASSLVDFGLWGGLVPGNLECMDELAERGVVGFKAFMSNSGTDDFQAADDLTLYEGMQHAAKLRLPVLVHAESDQITARLARRAVAEGRTGASDYNASRPVVAELEAIGRAILLAEETGCSLHVVHVSSGRGVALVASARTRGVDVTCETCPHYLVLTEEDSEELGAVAKCAPPLRSRFVQAGLWRQLLGGNVALVTSDHSPAPQDMKTGDNFFEVWGGISGCQSLLELLISEGHHEHGLSLAEVSALTSGRVAQRFGLSTRKGRIAVGADADLVIVDLDASFTLRNEDLFYRHRLSPFVGRTICGRVVRTIVRGTTVLLGGKVVSEPIGRLVKPYRTAEQHDEAACRSRFVEPQ
jgi:allantoinase